MKLSGKKFCFQIIEPLKIYFKITYSKYCLLLFPFHICIRNGLTITEIIVKFNEGGSYSQRQSLQPKT